MLCLGCSFVCAYVDWRYNANALIMEQSEFFSVWNTIDKDVYCSMLHVVSFPVNSLYERNKYYIFVLACLWCFLLKVIMAQHDKNMHAQFLSSSFSF